MTKFVRAHLTAVFILLLSAALDAQLTVSPSTATLTVGQTVQLNVQGGNGNPKWTTSNLNVASVSATGLVRGVGAGTATITVKRGSAFGQATVTVAGSPPPPDCTQGTWSVCSQDSCTTCTAGQKSCTATQTFTPSDSRCTATTRTCTVNGIPCTVSGVIQLAWDLSVSTGIVSQRVFVGTSSMTYSQMEVISPSATTYSFFGTPGVRYYFAVSAVDGSNRESPKSNEVNGVAPQGTLLLEPR